MAKEVKNSNTTVIEAKDLKNIQNIKSESRDFEYRRYIGFITSQESREIDLMISKCNDNDE